MRYDCGTKRIDRDELRSNGRTREPGHGWKPGDTTSEVPPVSGR